MPKTPKLPGSSKSRAARPRYYSDCISCKSNRSVELTIKKNEHGSTVASGRCNECGLYSSISVMSEEVFKSIRPSVLNDILKMTPEEELADSHFSEEDVKALMEPE